MTDEQLKKAAPGEGVYEVTEAELKGLIRELTDSLSILLAISTDAAEAGELELARLVSVFLLHQDEDTEAIRGLYERIPRLQAFVLERADANFSSGAAVSKENGAAGQCADYPNCSCGDIERSLEVMEGPLL